ncbi:MAG: isochorismatase family protein [Christensenellales bacterium]
MKILIVVDMQNGFITDKNIYLKNKINTLFKSNFYDKIILTKFINDVNRNPLYQKCLNWHKLTTQQEQEFCIDIPENATILIKYGYGLNQKDLEYLVSLNVNTIDICGLEAEACVYAIALQLFDLGIKPNILANYVDLNEQMQKIYVKQFGDVKIDI